MRRLFILLRSYFEERVRRVTDGIVARIMLVQAYRDVGSKPLSYRGWVATLVLAPEGCLILIAGRRAGELEDIAALLGALVVASRSKDPALPPFQVVSRTGRFVAWGWRPDGVDLSAREQTLILSTVLGPRERTTSYKDLN